MPVKQSRACASAGARHDSASALLSMQPGGFLTRATATLFVLATVTASTDPGPTVIVKLGGSAVSRKDKFETLNQAALTTTAKQIRASCGDARVLLVHGCGSFGHFQAHEYGISKGTAWPTFSWLGLARTRRSATKLNALILDALLAEELPAVHLSPFPLWRKRAGKPTARTAKAGVRHVRELLRAGLMPVMHGDCVVDERDGCGILSGDALLEALCLALRPELAVFLTDVPGVFSRPPSEQGKRELSFPRGSAGSPGAAGISSSVATHDVSGGLAAKLESAAAIAASGVPVCIVQVGTPHAAEALAGRWPEVCTRVVGQAQAAQGQDSK